MILFVKNSSYDTMLPARLGSAFGQVLVSIVPYLSFFTSRPTNETKYVFAVFRKLTELRRSKNSAEFYATANTYFVE